MIKKFIYKTFSTFLYFYRNLGYRIFVATTLSLLLGILDGFGLTMFLPLLEMVDESNEGNSEIMGNLQFIVDFIESLGFNLTLTTVLAFLCIFFTLKGLANFASKAYRVLVRLYFIRKTRFKMLRMLNNMSYKKFIFSDVGRIQNTMTGEIERVSGAYRAYFWTIEQSILVAVYMGFAFIIDIQFAILVSIGGFLTNLIYKQIYKKTKGVSRLLTKDSHGFQSLIIQHVANYKYLKATGLLSVFGEKLKSSIWDIENSKKKIGIHDATLSAAREPILIVVVAIVILIQTKYLGASLGPILISLIFFYRALNALMAMQVSYNQFLGTSGSMENLIQFEEELKASQETIGKEKYQGFNNSIKINEVSFKYENEKILKKVNLQINKNQTVAFVGSSGSGKTTLLNILAGLLPTDEGKVTIDGIDTKKIDIVSFQNRVGYITQEPVVFNDTIFNNVTFWAKPTKENIAKFKEATQKASIFQFIESLPVKDKTALGNNGINLSGGQKQRIAIARELFKGIDILFMDEATSALDSETEKTVQENIEQLKGKYTIIVVAHRLSTIRNADKIILMDKGKVIKTGPYNELIETAPKFQQMVKLQEL